MPSGTNHRRKGGAGSVPASPKRPVRGRKPAPVPPATLGTVLEAMGRSGSFAVVIGVASLVIGILALVVSAAQLMVSLAPPQPAVVAREQASTPPPVRCATPCTQYAIEILDGEGRSLEAAPVVPNDQPTT